MDKSIIVFVFMIPLLSVAGCIQKDGLKAGETPTPTSPTIPTATPTPTPVYSPYSGRN